MKPMVAKHIPRTRQANPSSENQPTNDSAKRSGPEKVVILGVTGCMDVGGIQSECGQNR